MVKHACDIALTERVSLTDALSRDPAVASRLDWAAIERLYAALAALTDSPVVIINRGSYAPMYPNMTSPIIIERKSTQSNEKWVDSE